MSFRRIANPNVAVALSGQFRMVASNDTKTTPARKVALSVGFQRGAAPFTSATTMEVETAALQSALDDVFGATTQDFQSVVGRKKQLLQTQLDDLTATGGELKVLTGKFDEMNAAAANHAHRVMVGTFLLLVAQNAVLFQWVFVTFDWNLVEPMTYFLGYSANTWLAMVFFKSTGRDFSYDGIVSELRQRKLDKLIQADSAFSMDRLTELQEQEAALRTSIRQL